MGKGSRSCRDERLGDVAEKALAGVLLVLLAPLFALVALAIVVDSRGPVFFRQQRIGRHHEAFEIWKFRTMVHGYSDARHREVALRELNGAPPLANGVAYKDVDDPGITRVGKILRRYSIDEVPQLV